MSHEGEVFTDRDHSWLIEAELPCGCFVIREAEEGQVHGISYCVLHESAPKLLAVLENVVEAGDEKERMDAAIERARVTITETKKGEPAFLPFLEL